MALRLRSREVPAPKVGGGMGIGNRCLQALLHRGDIPLPVRVISRTGPKLPASFVAAAAGALGAAQLPGPVVWPRRGQGSAKQPLPPAFAWPSDKMRVSGDFPPRRQKVRIKTSTG